jgi:hypothetical protein
MSSKLFRMDQRVEEIKAEPDGHDQPDDRLAHRMGS